MGGCRDAPALPRGQSRWWRSPAGAVAASPELTGAARLGRERSLVGSRRAALIRSGAQVPGYSGAAECCWKRPGSLSSRDNSCRLRSTICGQSQKAMSPAPKMSTVRLHATGREMSTSCGSRPFTTVTVIKQLPNSVTQPPFGEQPPSPAFGVILYEIAPNTATFHGESAQRCFVEMYKLGKLHFPSLLVLQCLRVTGGLVNTGLAQDLLAQGCFSHILCLFYLCVLFLISSFS